MLTVFWCHNLWSCCKLREGNDFKCVLNKRLLQCQWMSVFTSINFRSTFEGSEFIHGLHLCYIHLGVSKQWIIFSICCLLEVTLHEFFFSLHQEYHSKHWQMKQGKRERDFVRQTVINNGFIYTPTFWNLFWNLSVFLDFCVGITLKNSFFQKQFKPFLNHCLL